jgi:eukaryotic-like serine/threonine-protein kinase
MTIPAGTKLGRYEIRSVIGVGGMGEVYRASDERLGRDVAIKVLPSSISKDSDRLQRFGREAKATSSLNHPNIVTVFDIGEVEGVHFIAMELVDGVTLREELRKDRPDLRRILRYLQQVAKALTKAHAAGIIHRDLKPDNIMITRDEYAKVLDFGLAKLVEPAGPRNGTDGTSAEDATAIMQQHSIPGTIIGTSGYMSPEQASGRVNDIDQRSDIFSFGCILFEAATGEKAFPGKDTLDSLHKIVHAPTPQISNIDPGAARDLQRIVRRCLAKDPDQRYQSMREIAIELDELRKELGSVATADFDSEVGDSTAVQSSWISQTASDPDTSSRSLTNTAHADVRPTSSVKYLVTEVGTHKVAVGAGALLALLLLGGIFTGYIYYRSRTPSVETRGAAAANMKISRVTSSGKVRRAAISPDGNYIVHAVSDGGNESLWIRQTLTGSNVQIVQPAESTYWGITFSRDGNYIYYVSKEKGTGMGSLFRLPVLGGTPVALIKDVDSSITLSPDGQQVAYIRWALKQSGLWIANIDGTSERKLLMEEEPERLTGRPAWSPDGKVIACGVAHKDAGTKYGTIMAVNVDDGEKRPITQQRWGTLGGISWLDGQGLVMVAAEQREGAGSQVWFISYPDGNAQPITHDLNNYSDVTVTQDSKTLVAIQSETNSNVWLAPEGDFRRMRQLTTGKGRDGRRVGWTPDGKVLYDSDVSGRLGIWSVDPQSVEPRQLVSDLESESKDPVATPDGRYVLFDSNRSGNQHIWRVNADGSAPIQLTNTEFGEYVYTVTPDSRWVFYSASNGSDTVWKIPIEGGEPIRIGDLMSGLRVAPDGARFVSWKYGIDGRAHLAVTPEAPGSAAITYEVPKMIALSSILEWRRDGRAIFMIGSQDRASNIWSYTLDGGKFEQVTDFPSDEIFGFSFSPDGKQLAVTRGNTTHDVVLIKDFR